MARTPAPGVSCAAIARRNVAGSRTRSSWRASPQGGNEANQSEDCLFLNVVAPASTPAPRPVIVYIHGGAYSGGSGSSPLYDGSVLCRRGDVVVVTLNHRLGLCGYLYLPGS
jgi:para-nitrobenzyl esterase